MSPNHALVGGRYQLGARIAVGGMGEVWRAEDTVLHRAVAVKLLKHEFAGDDDFQRRFLSEARHAAVLEHPGVAQVYDFGDHPDPDDPVGGSHRPFLVMELVRGSPLSDHIGSGRTLPPAEAARIVALAADALQAAHDRQIVHRDIKPANLLLTDTGTVKVTDFGIAKAIGAVPVTVTGMVVGTPHYLSPEQASGGEVTAKSDVYSLGVVLYEALAGVRPFDRDSPVATALAHVRDEPPPLPDDVPAGLRESTARAMAKEPGQRHESAERLAHELRYGPASAAGAAAAVGGAAGASGGAGYATRVLPAPAPDTGPGATRAWWRRPALVAAAVVVLLLAAGVSAVALQAGGGSDSAAQAQPDGPSSGSETATSPEPAPDPSPETTTETTPETTPETTSEPALVTVAADDYLGQEWRDVEAQLEELGLVPEQVELDEETVAADPELSAVAEAVEPGSVKEAVLAVEPSGELPPGSTVTVSVYRLPTGQGNEGESQDNEGQGSNEGGGEGEGEDGDDRIIPSDAGDGA